MRNNPLRNSNVSYRKKEPLNQSSIQNSKILRVKPHEVMNIKESILHFSLNSNGEFIIFINKKLVVKGASYHENRVMETPTYQLSSADSPILGFEIDFQDKVWIAMREKCIVLDQELNKLKEYPVKKGRSHTEISLPSPRTSSLSLSNNQVHIAWYQSNFRVLVINSKTLEIAHILRGLVKNYDIERLMSFR